MADEQVRVYGYRWIALLAFSLSHGLMQVLWISFAPITGEAATFYNVSPLQIGFLSMVFMIVYLVVSIPASWAIDTWGIRKGVGIGVVLMGIFGLARGIWGDRYNLVVFATVMIAVAQPFILNSVTAMAARWFPIKERATAAGIAVLFQFIGIVAAMALTPPLTIAYGIPRMLLIYGIAAMAGMVLFLLLVRERPPTPPVVGLEEPRTLVFDGLRHIFKQRDMVLLIVIFFIGLGIFNAVTTWVEQMIAPRGFDITQAGNLGAVMMAAAIVGAIVIPILSDRRRKRRIYVIICLVGQIPGLIGLTFAESYGLLLASGAVFGFFLTGGAPVIYQYSAEICFPAPEATSQGLLLLAGQVSGIIFILGMDWFRTPSGSMTPFLIVMAVLAGINVILAQRMKESPLIKTEKEKN